MSHGLEVLHLVWEGAEKASAEVDQIREKVVSDQERPVRFDLLLEPVCEFIQAIPRSCAHYGSEIARIEVRQVTPSQRFRYPSEACLSPDPLLCLPVPLVPDRLLADFIVRNDLDKRLSTDGHQRRVLHLDQLMDKSSLEPV